MLNLLFFILLSSCAIMIEDVADTKGVELANIKDIRAFEGKWYVLAHIPMDFEKNAYEGYKTFSLVTYDSMKEDYRFKIESFASAQERYFFSGKILDVDKKSHWRMRKSQLTSFDYFIHYVDKKYSLAIVGTPDNDFVYVLARYKIITPKKWGFVKRKLESLGYLITSLRFMPQEVNSSLGKQL